MKEQMMNCFNEVKTRKFRYFSFRSDGDINDLNKYGIIKVTANLNDCPLWDLANFKFKEGSVMWGFAYEDDGFPKIKEYAGMTNLIEFKPDDKLLLFTEARHEILRGTLPVLLDVIFKDEIAMCRNEEEFYKLEESLLKYNLGMTDEFLEFCSNEKSKNGLYIIMFPYIKKESIVNITKYPEPNYREYINKPVEPKEEPNKDCECIFCNDKGCPVCKLEDYI